MRRLDMGLRCGCGAHGGMRGKVDSRSLRVAVEIPLNGNANGAAIGYWPSTCFSKLLSACA